MAIDRSVDGTSIFRKIRYVTSFIWLFYDSTKHFLDGHSVFWCTKMFSLGKEPYVSLQNDEIISFLSQGNRMEHFDDVPEEM